MGNGFVFIVGHGHGIADLIAFAFFQGYGKNIGGDGIVRKFRIIFLFVKTAFLQSDRTVDLVLRTAAKYPLRGGGMCVIVFIANNASDMLQMLVAVYIFAYGEKI